MWMSLSDVDKPLFDTENSIEDEPLEVITYFEAVMIFILFGFILYVLYPKDMLREQILAESSNYDLTAKYLENMLRLEPENKELTMTMIRTSIKNRQHELSLKLIEVMVKSADKELMQELVVYKLEALRVKYFSTNEAALRQEIVADIVALLDEVVEKHYYLDSDLDFWYDSARSFSLHKQALGFLKELLAVKKQAKLLEECFYLSVSLKNTSMQTQCLSDLRKMDSAHYREWTEKAYYIAMRKGDIHGAIALLQEMSKDSKKWQERLAAYYLELRQYKNSSNEYLRLLDSSKTHGYKKRYLGLALRSLQYGDLYNDAVILARKYESLYYNDEEMSMKIIRLYLSYNRLEDARRVSLKRLEYMK